MVYKIDFLFGTSVLLVGKHDSFNRLELWLMKALFYLSLQREKALAPMYSFRDLSLKLILLFYERKHQSSFGYVVPWLSQRL